MIVASQQHNDQSVSSSFDANTPMKSDDSTQGLSSSCDFEESLTSLCGGASLDLNQHISSRASREEKLLQVLGPFCPDDEDDVCRGQESFATDDFHFSDRILSSFSELHPIPENSSSKDDPKPENSTKDLRKPAVRYESKPISKMNLS